jgi:hypothetical protein
VVVPIQNLNPDVLMMERYLEHGDGIDRERARESESS